MPVNTYYYCIESYMKDASWTGSREGEDYLAVTLKSYQATVED